MAALFILPPTPSPTRKCTNIDTPRKLKVQVFEMM